MKTIEEVAFGRYLSDQSLPVRKRMDPTCYLDWAALGAREAQRWIPVEEELPATTEKILVKGKSKIIYLSYYNPKTKLFSSNCRITHWRPIDRK